MTATVDTGYSAAVLALNYCPTPPTCRRAHSQVHMILESQEYHGLQLIHRYTPWRIMEVIELTTLEWFS